MDDGRSDAGRFAVRAVALRALASLPIGLRRLQLACPPTRSPTDAASGCLTSRRFKYWQEGEIGEILAMHDKRPDSLVDNPTPIRFFLELKSFEQERFSTGSIQACARSASIRCLCKSGRTGWCGTQRSASSLHYEWLADADHARQFPPEGNQPRRAYAGPSRHQNGDEVPVKAGYEWTIAAPSVEGATTTRPSSFWDNPREL